MEHFLNQDEFQGINGTLYTDTESSIVMELPLVKIQELPEDDVTSQGSNFNGLQTYYFTNIRMEFKIERF